MVVATALSEHQAPQPRIGAHPEEPLRYRQDARPQALAPQPEREPPAKGRVCGRAPHGDAGDVPTAEGGRVEADGRREDLAVADLLGELEHAAVHGAPRHAQRADRPTQEIFETRLRLGELATDLPRPQTAQHAVRRAMRADCEESRG